MAQCQGPHGQIRIFLVFTSTWQENIAKNPKVPEAQLNVNPARAITWFVGVTIYCTFFDYNSLPPRQFLCYKILLKKISYSKGNTQ